MAALILKGDAVVAANIYLQQAILLLSVKLFSNPNTTHLVTMRIRSIKVSKYRSIEQAEVVNCGNLNILIGKNNAGKSNILAAIELVQNHLSKAVIASRWVVSRPNDEFYDRHISRGIQIAVEYGMPASINDALRHNLQTNFPNLERAIAELEKSNSIVFILAGAVHNEKPFLFIENICAGYLQDNKDIITAKGAPLLAVPQNVAHELFAFQEELAALKSDLLALNSITSRTRDFGHFFSGSNREMYRKNAAAYIGNITVNTQISPELRRNLIALFSSSDSQDEFIKGVESLILDLNSRAEETQKKETSRPFNTFAGETRIQPDYVGMLMDSYGSIPMLHLKESKTPIGREEAEELLKLKITRGGPERLKLVQNTVRSLLGVEVDAFQPDENVGKGNLTAEMDVDQFLAEANGAGVRESLRLILDLELKSPKLVLLEEPEVHLHPGLEYSIHAYLKDKSKDIQIFTTTHSTNFVDSIAFQNIYLISREKAHGTKILVIDEKIGALKIPAALGLKLSTVFMYDRLLFVEGPSDEAVLRQFAEILNIDLAKANMNFVQMGGVTNFAHYAAESTLSLLSRRNLKLWFLIDKDEKTESEVAVMIQRLGHNAKLTTTNFRDLENYLLEPIAVQKFVKYKLEAAGKDANPTVEEIESAIEVSAQSLKSEFIKRKINSKVLKPVYLQRRDKEGSEEERLKTALSELQSRLDKLQETQSQISIEIESDWVDNAQKLAPGAEILDKCCQKFGVRFQKEEGDSAKLASLISINKIPTELKSLLEEIVNS